LFGGGAAINLEIKKLEEEREILKEDLDLKIMEIGNSMSLIFKL
jgi:hypothetical protein